MRDSHSSYLTPFNLGISTRSIQFLMNVPRIAHFLSVGWSPYFPYKWMSYGWQIFLLFDLYDDCAGHNSYHKCSSHPWVSLGPSSLAFTHSAFYQHTFVGFWYLRVDVVPMEKGSNRLHFTLANFTLQTRPQIFKPWTQSFTFSY